MDLLLKLITLPYFYFPEYSMAISGASAKIVRESVRIGAHIVQVWSALAQDELCQ